MQTLSLTTDELLSTTRAVRRRLDLTRPVERQVLEDCLTLAQQAPRGSNIESRRFVVVTDPEKKAALAALWRRGYARYIRRPPNPGAEDGRQGATRARILSSVQHLAEHLHEVPVHVVPCMLGRYEDKPAWVQSSMYGSILPATWSFMLAARACGLGTCWTTFHLMFEEEAAAILDIPYAEVTQVALIPVAYTVGTEFKPRAPEPLSNLVMWNSWERPVPE
jgi:nitroreductase